MRQDRGATLVEFAILAPLLFALVFGTITGGIALSRKNSMTNAVREGARFGATVPESASWATSVRDRTVSLAGGDLTNAQVCVELTMGSGSRVTGTPATCPFSGIPPVPAGVAPDQCVVRVWAERTSQLEAVFFTRDLTLRSNAVARFERGGTGTCAA